MVVTLSIAVVIASTDITVDFSDYLTEVWGLGQTLGWIQPKTHLSTRFKLRRDQLGHVSVSWLLVGLSVLILLLSFIVFWIVDMRLLRSHACDLISKRTAHRPAVFFLSEAQVTHRADKLLVSLIVHALP